MRLTGLTLPILLGALLLQVVIVEMMRRVCPQSTIPENSCLARKPSIECWSDDSCKGGKKCCVFNCDLVCKDLVVMKPGDCPQSTKPFSACFRKRPLTECRTDACCNGTQKCCLYNCDYLCKDPEVKKPGECPEPSIPVGPCSLGRLWGECLSDLNCTGTQKCCLYGCVYSCKRPAVSIWDK